MDLDHLNSLPEWGDHKLLKRMYEGEEWKMKKQMDAAEALYNKWREIFPLVECYCDTLQNSPDYEHSDQNKELIYQNLFIVAPKIIGAAGTPSYVLKMENASVIRNNCRELMEQVKFAALVGAGEEKYAEAIEEEMDKFRDLFRNWVTTFVKDSDEDEWGLYV